MMTSKDIRTYSFSSSDQLLFDTNVWITLYGPQPKRSSKTQAYSDALLRILNAKSTIYIDVLILSEFINRYARFEHNLEKQGGGFVEFKAYRRSPAFESIAKVIAAISRKILNHCERTDSCFESIDVNILLANYESACPDFNDQIFVNLCKEKEFTLVTHDIDFKDFDVTVLTANKQLLNSSSIS